VFESGFACKSAGGELVCDSPEHGDGKRWAIRNCETDAFPIGDGCDPLETLTVIVQIDLEVGGKSSAENHLAGAVCRDQVGVKVPFEIEPSPLTVSVPVRGPFPSATIWPTAYP
jgi:hypothetical protein